MEERSSQLFTQLNQLHLIVSYLHNSVEFKYTRSRLYWKINNKFMNVTFPLFIPRQLKQVQKMPRYELLNCCNNYTYLRLVPGTLVENVFICLETTINRALIKTNQLIEYIFYTGLCKRSLCHSSHGPVSGKNM